MTVARIAVALTVLIAVLGGANYYVARRLFKWVGLLIPSLNTRVFIASYTVLAVVMILGLARSFLPFPDPLKNALSWISMYWIGLFVYLLMFNLVADLVLVFGRVTRLIPSPASFSSRLISGSLVVALSLGVVIYGVINSRQIRHVTYHLQLEARNVPHEFRITMVSDLHLGGTNNEANLSKIVEIINDSAPDVVCLVGDIFNDDFTAIREPDTAGRLLASIRARHGVYASLGNHDGGKTFPQMVQFLEKHDVTLLNDDFRVIDGQLVLVGRVDGSPIGGFGDLHRGDMSAILASINSDLPVVVMDHDPAVIDQYGNEINLLISGHSHGGQIIPGNLITGAMYAQDHGYYRKDANSPHVIVSSGVGTWGTPLRVGTHSEVVTITLRPE